MRQPSEPTKVSIMASAPPVQVEACSSMQPHIEEGLSPRKEASPWNSGTGSQKAPEQGGAQPRLRCKAEADALDTWHSWDGSSSSFPGKPPRPSDWASAETV
ncbi:Hypothetical predicted protein [Pelobates cultripes]|uniref:Uncharacterized protein n=1 Tax=Pelobates cultripes TaxID=61616 RepID=A0AAD1RM86_PELCU|nr:Hypothetical predicted protein [Pelobates cultripes]